MSELVDRIAGLSPAKRALLEAMAARRQPGAAAGIPRRADPSTAPLSFAQERVWFLEQLEPGTMTYHLPLALRVEGPFDPEWISRGLAMLIARHEALRTTIAHVDGRPVQRVAPTGAEALEVVDLADTPSEDRDEALARVARITFERPFDLTNGPLHRTVVVRLQPETHVVLLVMHHLIADGWSMDVFVEEMFGCCLAFAAGTAPVLPPLPVQFGDYAAWQRTTVEGPAFEEQSAYWRRQLAGVPNLDLPADRPRPPVLSYRGRTRTFALDAVLTRRLHEVSRRHEVTVFTTLLSAFVVLLARYSGQRDIAVGSPVANRSRSEIERVIGFFASTLVFRVDAAGNPSFADLMRRVRDVVVEGQDRQDVPFEQLVEMLQPRRDPSRNPLFQVMLALQKPSRLGAGGGGAIAASLLPVDATAAKFDLTLTFQEHQQQLAGTLEYSTDLFDDATAVRLTDHFTTLLHSALEDPSARVDDLAMIGEEERTRLITGWNDTAVEWPSFACLHELIEAQVERTPDAAAVIADGERLSYAELNARANRLARTLRARGIGSDKVVGVCLDRSADLVVALLAILKAGGAYLPLDPSYPPDRLSFMLADAGAPLVIGERRSPVGQAVAAASGAAFVDVAEAAAPGFAAGSSNPRVAVPLDAAAYVIYTSGSTGRPKGVVCTHRGIVNRLLWMQAAYGLDAGDRVIQKTPFTFDVSVWEFFWPLMTGAGLVVARPGGHRDPLYLATLIADHDVTTAHFVPSMLELFLEEPASARCRGLRRIICSGEALGLDLQQRCRERLPAALHNLYGPTEASVDVTYWPCAETGDRRFVPIGRPIANTRMYVVDERFEPAPVGVPGELLIGGVGLARGYLGRPDLTAERFVPDPFGGDSGGRVYRTGDRARVHADGVIEFLGRRDHQVKIRGFRVEPGEIESVIARCEGVQRVAVVVRGTSIEATLVAYIVPAPGAVPSDAALRDALRRSLPEYMVPSAFVAIDALPVTSSGKLDRAALPAPRPSASPAAVAPRDDTEARIAAIWRAALKTGEIGVEDDFFDLGGHSMLAARVLASMRDAFGVAIPLRTLFETPTVLGLARAVSARLAGGDPDADDHAAVNLEREVHLPPEIWPPLASSRRDGVPRVLLTGASGFLGAYLLRSLIDRTSSEVVCLARAAAPDEGVARLKRILQGYRLWRDGDERRIRVVCGDLAAPRLGLAADAFEAIASDVDAIYHNGALVNFLHPYRALAPSNVAGTVEVMRLACTGVLKPVHYVSTIDVLGDGYLEVSEDAPLSHPRGLATGYAQSKWVAERVMAIARDRGVPVAIYRPGRIIGDSRTGVWNTDDFAARLIKGCVQAGVAPADPPWDNLAPVDFVGAAIVEASLNPAAVATPALHVVNPNWFFWSRMIAFVRDRGYPLRVVSYAEWYRTIHAADAVAGGAGAGANALAPLLPLFPVPPQADAGEAPPAPPPGEDRRVDPPAPQCQRAHALLAGTGVRCPAIDDVLLERYLDYFVGSGYLAPPPSRHAREPVRPQ